MRLADCNTQVNSGLLLLSMNTMFGLSCIDLICTSRLCEMYASGNITRAIQVKMEERLGYQMYASVDGAIGLGYVLILGSLYTLCVITVN